MKKLFLLMVFLCALGLIYINYNNALDNEFLYAGTLDATRIDVASQVSSKIEEVRVEEGDKVQKGEEIIVLTCEDIKTDARIANRDFFRNSQLYKQGVVSVDILDDVIKERDNTNILVDWCTIDSPLNGTVLTKVLEPGEYVGPGSKIVTIADIKDIWAFIYVPQQMIAELSLGMTLVGVVPEMGNREFLGKIIKINSEAEFTPKNVQTQSERTRLVYGVKVSFLGSNEAEFLKPGMTIYINLPENKYE